MTNSTKRRQNDNARYVAGMTWPGYAIAGWRAAYGAFSPADAERYARREMTLYDDFDPERLDEVNWSYAAELMNGMAI